MKSSRPDDLRSRVRQHPVPVLTKRVEPGRCVEKGLFLSDIPLHDATRELVLLSEKWEAEYKLAQNLEVLTDQLQQTYRELEDEKKKTDR